MLSVIIPARNEAYLERTIRNILTNAEGDIEIIAILDGYLPEPPIEMNDDRVIFHHFPEAIGQRQAVNYGAKVAKGKYIMKLDAHCAVDKGFDVKLAADCDYDWTVIPRMYNLDIETFEPKLHKRTDYMYIGMTEGRELRAEYYGSRQPKNDKLIDDTMCNMGPGWFMHKDRFWELGGMDEGHGGWGQMGVEVSLKAWLSGGALKVNKNTWFAHWFRGGGGPGFPYKITGNAVERARRYSRDLWLNDKWPLAKRKLKWLVDKFNPPGWESWKANDLTILFYTANVVSSKIMAPVVRSLKKHGYPIISVSQEPMDLGKNIVVPKHRSLQNIYRQVLIAAKEAQTQYVALCEDDCLYVAEHFKYRPKSAFGYNLNRWLLHLDEKVYSYRKRPILSQCIADREALIKNLEERFTVPEIPDKYCGEPGCFDKQLGMTQYEYETFETKDSNLVICHNRNTSGRKYVGKDAEPTTTLPVWGDIQYWLTKFTPAQKWGRGAKPQSRRQHSHIGSVILEVEDICNNRMDYCDPRKKESLAWFMKCFNPFLEQVIKYYNEGKEFTDEELEQFEYYQYHLSKLHPADKDPYTEKGKRRCRFLMRDVVNLYKDIKENGLRNPLDMWRDGDRLVLHRGGRRLEIMRALGYRRVPCRVFKTREAFIKLCPDREIKINNSIHCLGMQQFQKLKERATDKYWVHTYTRLYDKHIGYLRPNAEKILELGVFRGASLLLWRDAFPKAHIYGVDWKKRSDWVMKEKEDRITFLLGNQCDDEFMRTQVAPLGQFDVIVDDAGHRGDEMTVSFKILWDAVKSGGWYVLEDLYGHYRKDRKSMMPLLKGMVDDINLQLTIKAMHFYYNICFVEKM